MDSEILSLAVELLNEIAGRTTLEYAFYWLDGDDDTGYCLILGTGDNERRPFGHRHRDAQELAFMLQAYVIGRRAALSGTF